MAICAGKDNTDGGNRMMSYSILNNASDDFNKGFQYLIGYQFDKKLPIHRHPLVFCMTIENKKSGCDAVKKQYTPSEVLAMVFANLAQQFKADPKTILITQIPMLAYSFYSVR